MVRTQGIITQLIFDHALRIRVKADVTTPSSSTRSTAATTPDSASVVETATPGSGPSSGRESPENGSEQTATGDGLLPAGKDKKRRRGSESSSKSKGAVSEKSGEEGVKGGNLAGKLNNLITTDLNNLVDGRDFLFIGEWSHH